MTHVEIDAGEERARADGLEEALIAVTARLDVFSLLAAADELRARTTATLAEAEGLAHAASILDDAASRIALGPIFARFKVR